MAKHYIRLDESNNIVKAFTDFFEPALETDSLMWEGAGNQFQILFPDGSYSECNPPISINQIYLYRYENGLIIIKTPEEIESEILPTPVPPPSDRVRLSALEDFMMMFL